MGNSPKQNAIGEVNLGSAQDLFLIPGRYIDRGETISQAVVREVKEETGLDVEAQGIVGVRSIVRSDGLTDIYFVQVCSLKSDPERIVKDKEEIREVQWINVSEIQDRNDVHQYIKLLLKQVEEKSPLKQEYSMNDFMIEKNNLLEYEQFWIS